MKQPAHDSADHELISGALNGSLSAWELLVRRYEGRVYNFSLRLTGNADDAMDLMQEVFLGVYRNLERFRGESLFSTWLFRIAHNKAVDMARRRGVGPPTEPATEAQQEQAQGDEQFHPEHELQQRQLNDQIKRLLTQLPAEQRMTIELKFYQELTFEQIADIEDISANTAKTRFYSAIRKLKELLENAP